MKKIIITVSMLCLLSSLSAQHRINNIDSRIIAWTINYYRSNSVKLTSYDVHCFFIEEIKKKNGDTLALYNVGLNRSGIPDLILILDTEKSALNLIRPIGISEFKSNLYSMFDFFSQYPQFSDESKVICYEKLIIGDDNRIYRKKSTGSKN